MSDKQQADPVSVNIFDLIDSICAKFRQEWKAGKQPRIEDYLFKVPEDARETLLRNLLAVDVRHRERGGEKPRPDDYLKRFPTYTRVIGDAFHYSTSIEVQALQTTPADDSMDVPVTIGIPVAKRIGDYELLRELGRGGFGVVYEAKHITRQNLVALKTLPTGQIGQEINAERLHRFRKEFRSLSEINHPNLVGMQTLEVDGGQWFFTMDLVSGVDFLSYVRPKGRTDEGRLRDTLKQLARGIHALHEKGIVHRDLKPSNVIVQENGHVVILDFGLVAELRAHDDQTVSMQTQQFAGTPQYAAPEQALGMRGSPSDWYALGVMLYESLTGEVPFRGTAVEILIKKQSEDAPRLVGHNEFPPDLAQLADQLLIRDPDQRPDSRAIAAALGVTFDSSSHDSTASLSRDASGASDLVLIGRESQLEQLDSARKRLLEKDEPHVVFIRGRSGEGKTTLVERFLSSVHWDRAAIVLAGRCYDRESVPFKVIDSLIDSLVAYLRVRTTDEVQALLPNDIEMLAQLFPLLRRVDAIDQRATQDLAALDHRQVRFRAFAALRELLVTLSTSAPLILFIDDLQWGDADSATALHELLNSPQAPRVMLLGTYRIDEAEQSPFLNDWRECQSQAERSLPQQIIEVTPLTESQCLSLVYDRLGIKRESLPVRMRQIFEDTSGNPYFLEQLIEGFDPETGQFAVVPMVDIIDRKLKRLPEEAKALLQAIAIAGQAVALFEAETVARGVDNAFATVTHMRSERLVRIVGFGDSRLVDTYHDKIRETVLENLEAASRRQLHLRFGEFLEGETQTTAAEILSLLDQDPSASPSLAMVTERVYDLAYHFHMAKDPRAFAYQLMAGELSYQAYASEDAIEYLKRAEELLPAETSNAVRYRLWNRQAASQLRLGHLDEAHQHYQRCLPLASSSISRTEIYKAIGIIFASRGQYSLAIENYDAALIELKRPRRRGFIAGLMSLPMAIRAYCLALS